MDSWRLAAATLVNDLQRVFAGRLRSLVAYGPRVEGAADGPLTCLALVDSLGVTDLDACAALTHQWERHGLATPLILPDQEFRRSLDAFPLEYAEILRAHERIFGADPFDGVVISPEDLRRACETQVKSHLLHLREAFMETGGRPQAIADLVRTSAPAFAALLRNVARLNGGASSARADATRDGAHAAGLADAIVADVLALDRADTNPIPTTDAARLFPQYLAAVEQLARAVDSWRA
jgi:hypothetical protein